MCGRDDSAGAKATSFTCGEFGSMAITSSTCSAMSRGLAAVSAPRPVTHGGWRIASADDS